MSFIHHSLMMLEDAGMTVGYPEIDRVTFDENGNRKRHMSVSSRIGRRVSIEQNPHMKLLMMFALLDFHVDTTHPDMEGKSYRQKYEGLPFAGDYDLMLRELFRVAKLMRNALVHNPSSFEIADEHVNIGYTYGKTDFRLKMSTEALASFYTAIVMYLKGDIGRGNYFLGLMRSIYTDTLAGIKDFNDDLGNALLAPPLGIKMKSGNRLICSNLQHEISEGLVRIHAPDGKLQPREGMDFHVRHNGNDFLIPLEALNEDRMISESDLVAYWAYEGHFPSINRS